MRIINKIGLLSLVVLLLGSCTKRRDNKMLDFYKSQPRPAAFIGKWKLVRYVTNNGNELTNEELKNMAYYKMTFHEDGRFQQFAYLNDREAKLDFKKYWYATGARFNLFFKSTSIMYGSYEATYNYRFSPNMDTLQRTEGNIAYYVKE